MARLRSQGCGRVDFDLNRTQLLDWSVPDLTLPKPNFALGPTDFEAGWNIEYSARESEGAYLLCFGDSAAFRACFRTKTITLVAASTDDPATLGHLLYDHVIPRVMSAIAPLVLHGSLVRMKTGLAVFSGETGAGKSTLGASLHARGDQLLGDDAVIVSEHGGVFFAEAVYPSLRLYPDSIGKILGEGIGTAPMALYSDKRHVTGILEEPVDSSPAPITCFFTLRQGNGDPHVRRFSVRETCMAMIDQSFALVLQDVAAASTRMSAAAKLASRVPGFELTIPHDYECLPRIHELIDRCMTEAARNRASESVAARSHP